MVAVLTLFWLVAPAGWWLAPVAFLTTAIASVLVINLQVRLMDVADDAVTLGAAMNHASLNIANALGAFAGGVALDVWSAREAPLVGAGLAVAGMLVLLWSTSIHRRRA
jgi:DHA1 family inner membrane transport protein